MASEDKSNPDAGLLKAGVKAPEFSLMDQHGKAHALSDHAGKWVVLYFYPKDDTPGCTKEACAFRDASSAYAGLDAVVLGVSADTVDSHAKFATKFDLSFPLLADPEHTMLEAYGVWQEKSMYGRTYMGIARVTYLVNPKGKIAHVWPKVKVDGHDAEVRERIEALTK